MVSPLRLTRIGVGRGRGNATLHSSRQFRFVSSAFAGHAVRVGRMRRSPARAPLLVGEAAPAVSVDVCLRISDYAGDLTEEALIGAFIGSVSALEARRALDADAETLSITRLEGSRWRGGRLWSWNRDPERGPEEMERSAARERRRHARRRVARARRVPVGGARSRGLRHTTPETWTTTWSTTTADADDAARS